MKPTWEKTTMTTTSIGVIMTTFNRKASTLKSLESLAFAAQRAGVRPIVFLTDAGSDGTAQSVLEQYPDAVVDQVDKNVYWNRGMALSMSSAIKDSSLPFFLWLNDDTVLREEAINDIFRALHSVFARPEQRQIVVGETLDPSNGALTYGALFPSKAHPLRFSLRTEAHLGDTPVTFNGNCVFLPREVVDELGTIDASYTHAYGDIDYGLRATQAGIPITVVPKAIGWCVRNPPAGTWADVTAPLSFRLKDIFGPKGRPWRDQYHFARRFGGRLWPYWAIRPYMGVIASSLKNKWGVRLHG